MAEIKVGDKVRLTQDVSYSNHKKGDIGVVKSYVNNISGLLRVRMEYNNTSRDSTPFEPNEIELVEDVKVFKVGDKVRVAKLAETTNGGYVAPNIFGLIGEVKDIDWEGDALVDAYYETQYIAPEYLTLIEEDAALVEQEPVADAISPSAYQFPSGVEVRDISAHLTSFGGQAVQYVCRSTRLDGIVKGLPVQDLKKAIQLLEWEVERLES